MIYDVLSNADKYGFCPAILSVLNYAKTITPETYPAACVVLDGDAVFINAPQYDTHAAADASAEAHRAYIDVMVMIDGEETIYVKNTDRLRHITMEYDEAQDALLADLDDDVTAVRMTPGYFCILYPQDAHAPGCHANGTSSVKKLIGKVRIG